MINYYVDHLKKLKKPKYPKYMGLIQVHLEDLYETRDIGSGEEG